MNFYYQYPIRCPSCNEHIACLSRYFISLVENGSPTEDALNEIGLYKWCSRIAMLNPSPIFFNMENTDVIEGLASVEHNDNIEGLVSIGKRNYEPVKTQNLDEENEEVFEFLTMQRKAPRKKAVEKQLQFSRGEEVEADIYDGIPISEFEQEEGFIEPTIVGIPTINNVRDDDLLIVSVGDRKTTIVLKGRTYLAR